MKKIVNACLVDVISGVWCRVEHMSNRMVVVDFNFKNPFVMEFFSFSKFFVPNEHVFKIFT